MQQRLTSILLLILYLTTNVGYSLDMHYMNGKLMDASYNDSASCIMDCDMHSNMSEKQHFTHSLQEHIQWMAENNQNSNGCSDHEIQIKIDDPQINSKAEIINIPFTAVLIIVHHFELTPQLSNNNLDFSNNITDFHPPSVPFYISYQRLVLYS